MRDDRFCETESRRNSNKSGGRASDGRIFDGS